MSGLSATIEQVQRLSPSRLLPVEHRLRVAGADVVEVQLRIVGAGQPRHAAAVEHRFGVGPGLGARLARPRRRVPAPHDVAALRIARLEIAGHVERVAADADQHLLADDDRRARREVLALDVGDLVVPALLARRRVERDEVVVGRQEEDPVAVHADAAIADVDAAARLPEVVPDLAAGARVDGPHVIGRREIQHAVDHQRRRLDRRRTESAGRRRRRVGAFAADVRERLRRVQPVDPGELQVLDVVGVDLRERAVAAARVVAVVGRPGVGRRLRAGATDRAPLALLPRRATAGDRRAAPAGQPEPRI